MVLSQRWIIIISCIGGVVVLMVMGLLIVYLWSSKRQAKKHIAAQHNALRVKDIHGLQHAVVGEARVHTQMRYHEDQMRQQAAQANIAIAKRDVQLSHMGLAGSPLPPVPVIVPAGMIDDRFQESYYSSDSS